MKQNLSRKNFATWSKNDINNNFQRLENISKKNGGNARAKHLVRNYEQSRDAGTGNADATLPLFPLAIDKLSVIFVLSFFLFFFFYAESATLRVFEHGLLLFPGNGSGPPEIKGSQGGRSLIFFLPLPSVFFRLPRRARSCPPLPPSPVALIFFCSFAFTTPRGPLMKNLFSALFLWGHVLTVGVVASGAPLRNVFSIKSFRPVLVIIERIINQPFELVGTPHFLRLVFSKFCFDLRRSYRTMIWFNWRTNIFHWNNHRILVRFAQHEGGKTRKRFCSIFSIGQRSYDYTCMYIRIISVLDIDVSIKKISLHHFPLKRLPVLDRVYCSYCLY